MSGEGKVREAYVRVNPIGEKGSILAYVSPQNVEGVGSGKNGQTIVADSESPTGLSWKDRSDLPEFSKLLASSQVINSVDGTLTLDPSHRVVVVDSISSGDVLKFSDVTYPDGRVNPNGHQSTIMFNVDPSNLTLEGGTVEVGDRPTEATFAALIRVEDEWNIVWPQSSTSTSDIDSINDQIDGQAVLYIEHLNSPTIVVDYGPDKEIDISQVVSYLSESVNRSLFNTNRPAYTTPQYMLGPVGINYTYVEARKNVYSSYEVLDENRTLYYGFLIEDKDLSRHPDKFDSPVYYLNPEFKEETLSMLRDSYEYTESNGYTYMIPTTISGTFFPFTIKGIPKEVITVSDRINHSPYIITPEVSGVDPHLIVEIPNIPDLPDYQNLMYYTDDTGQLYYQVVERGSPIGDAVPHTTRKFRLPLEEIVQ